MHIFVSRTYTQPDIYVKFCFTLSDTYELEGIICFFFFLFYNSEKQPTSSAKSIKYFAHRRLPNEWRN